MPPKKTKVVSSQAEVSVKNKTIKVKKLEPENISKDSIIKSNIKIIEPTIETIENEEEHEEEHTEDKTHDEEHTEDKTHEHEEHVNKSIDNIDMNESESDTNSASMPTPHTKLNKSPLKEEKYNVKDSKDRQDRQDRQESKEVKKDKVHNHSKPKTIIASTKDDNTVDMFGEDDLDFRYVMMNYDYTKNVTMPKITKYERALLIGKRAKQIEEGANPNVKYISGQSVVSIAEEELRQRKIPLIIKRPIGNKFEYWKPADMEVNMD